MIKGLFRFDIPETLRIKHLPNNILVVSGEFPSDNTFITLRFKMDKATKAFYCKQSAMSRNEKIEFLLIQISDDQEYFVMYWFPDVPSKRDTEQFIKNFLPKQQQIF